MHVLLSVFGSCGDADPVVEPVLRLRALGAEVQMCALPDFADVTADRI